MSVCGKVQAGRGGAGRARQGGVAARRYVRELAHEPFEDNNLFGSLTCARFADCRFPRARRKVEGFGSRAWIRQTYRALRRRWDGITSHYTESRFFRSSKSIATMKVALALSFVASAAAFSQVRNSRAPLVYWREGGVEWDALLLRS